MQCFSINEKEGGVSIAEGRELQGIVVFFLSAPLCSSCQIEDQLKCNVFTMKTQTNPYVLPPNTLKQCPFGNAFHNNMLVTYLVQDAQFRLGLQCFSKTLRLFLSVSTFCISFKNISRDCPQALLVQETLSVKML